MNEDLLINRSAGLCELCAATEELSAYEVAPSDGSVEQSILICPVCKSGLESADALDENHWRCLNDSMWSQEPAVQVVVYRILKRLNAQDLLSMMYMEPDVQAWAESGDESESEESITVKDSNGSTLETGDSVTIIKDLEVKGAGFTAKRGTVVKNIGLNGIEGQIEGRVNGTRIVLLSKFLKKS